MRPPATKRVFDVTGSLLGLMLLWPVLILTAILIKVESTGPVFFRQERMGRGGRPFYIFKFRTMFQDASERGGLITFGSDPRITRVGRVLRKIKVDELPQLINVLRGDMSLVGPRPEVRKYVELFHEDYGQILRIKPGITDLASLKYRDEAAILGRFENPEEEYVRRVLPDKIQLSKEHLNHSSLFFDLYVILKTLVKLLA